MRGNTFGNLFSVTSFGESHGPALGVVIDGVPAGLEVSYEELCQALEKRRPGRLDVSTARNEPDRPEILSGIYLNKTLGTPISVIVKNKDQRSKDYNQLKSEYRPGHADKTTELKFGFRDHRGGGRSSGRETLSRVIAGYFASLLIPQIKCTAMIKEVGKFCADQSDLDSYVYQPESLGFARSKQDPELRKYLLELKSSGNSIGGTVYLKIENCPAGLGEPVFDKLKADLSKAMLSIGSCMGVNFGRGEEFSRLTGTEISSESSNFSGIEGGISNGETIYLEAYFKAPSTIGEKAKEGRHDPCILPRVLPVVESMSKIVLADHFLRQNAFQY